MHRMIRRSCALMKTCSRDLRQAAARFYYLNRTCYNGLCRFNRKGEFNVPFGSYKTIHYLNTENFHEYRETLSRWTFTASDFQNIQLQPDDFVYADPPYDVQFVNYSKHGFSWDDQVRLAEYAGRIVELTDEQQAHWRDGGAIDIYEAMTRLTLEIVGQLFFGVSSKARANELLEPVDTAERMVDRYGTSGADTQRFMQTREQEDLVINEMLAARRKDPNSLRPAGVDIPLRIHLHAIRYTGSLDRTGVGELAPSRNRPVCCDVVAHPIWLRLRVRDVKHFPIRRECDAVGTRKISDDGFHFAVYVAIHAIELDVFRRVVIAFG